jgi:hypothetical protein
VNYNGNDLLLAEPPLNQQLRAYLKRLSLPGIIRSFALSLQGNPHAIYDVASIASCI